MAKLCPWCYQPPETTTTNQGYGDGIPAVRCATENCIARLAIGWVSLVTWDARYEAVGCFHCGKSCETLCSDCAINYDVKLAVCSDCTAIHTRWESIPDSHRRIYEREAEHG